MTRKKKYVEFEVVDTRREHAVSTRQEFDHSPTASEMSVFLVGLPGNAAISLYDDYTASRGFVDLKQPNVWRLSASWTEKR